MTLRIWNLVAVAAAIAVTLSEVTEAVSAPITVSDLHDPAITKYGSATYCAFGTGLSQTAANPGGIRVKKLSSINIAGGTYVDSGIIAVPSWVRSQYSTAVNVWAPEILKEDSSSTYYIYYAVSDFGKQNSAIGVASTTTPCDASSWVDHGKILSSQTGSPFNAIDPNVLRDSNGQLWMTFGSFYGGIYSVKMSSPTAVIPSNAAFTLVDRRSSPDAVEGASVIKHGNFYYMFTSWDSCCKGLASTYKTRVGRSTSVSGPFVDENGVQLTNGGGTSFLAAQGNFIGPGGGDAFIDTVSGVSTWWYIFHYYDGAQNGAVKTALQAITWSSSGWPQSTLTA